MIRILLIVAFEKFRDEEYDIPKKLFEEAGIKTITASSKSGTATGKFGMKAKIDLTLDQVKVGDYDAILFIGGPGSYDYYKNPICHKIAQETIKEGKILGAICAAPGILANAGVLKGKKATIHHEDIETLKKGGANYAGKGVEIDGKIITATGPQTAKEWAEAIIKSLEKNSV